MEFRTDIREGLKDFFPLAMALYGIWDWRDAATFFRQRDAARTVERLRREKRALVADAQKIRTLNEAPIESWLAAESILAVAKPWDGLNKQATELTSLHEVGPDGRTLDERTEEANAHANPTLPPSCFQEFLPFARMVKKTWELNREGTLRGYESKKALFEIALQASGDSDRCAHQDYLAAKLVIAVARICDWPITR